MYNKPEFEFVFGQKTYALSNTGIILTYSIVLCAFLDSNKPIQVLPGWFIFEQLMSEYIMKYIATHVKLNFYCTFRKTCPSVKSKLVIKLRLNLEWTFYNQIK